MQHQFFPILWFKNTIEKPVLLRKPITRVITNVSQSMHCLCSWLQHCFKCLTIRHYGRDCRRPNIKCQICEQIYHTLLHMVSINNFPKRKVKFQLMCSWSVLLQKTNYSLCCNRAQRTKIHWMNSDFNRLILQVFRLRLRAGICDYKNG